MSNVDDLNVTVYKSQKDLPSELLWQDVCDQIARMFYDLDRTDLTKTLETCINPEIGAIVWQGEISPEVPSVKLAIHGPIEGALDRSWSCDVHFHPHADRGWELTDTSSTAILMHGIRLLALKTFVEDLNNKPNLGSTQYQLGKPDVPDSATDDDVTVS